MELKWVLEILIVMICGAFKFLKFINIKIHAHRESLDYDQFPVVLMHWEVSVGM